MVELLVVIGIISILIGLVIVIAGKAMNQSHNAQDLSNLRLLGMSTWSYATDHKGRLLSSRSEGDGHPQDIIDRFWIRSYGTDVNGDPRMVTVEDQATELLSTLRDGEAFPYIGDVRAYSSPFDPTIGILEEYVPQNQNLKPYRIRSYAFNALVGCKWGPDDHWGFHTGWQNWPTNFPDCGVYTPTPHVCKYFLPTETISQIPQPGGTMVAIGEHDLWGRNLGGFTLHPTEMKWIDVPALWNHGLINMSYVDGSTGAIQFESKGLEAAWRANEHDFFYTDAEDDYRKIRKVLLPGVIGNILDLDVIE